ncbi:MAG: virulence factor TspB C-terminal domain-related protein [Pseudomonadota bacterium]
MSRFALLVTTILFAPGASSQATVHTGDGWWESVSGGRFDSAQNACAIRPTSGESPNQIIFCSAQLSSSGNSANCTAHHERLNPEGCSQNFRSLGTVRLKTDPFCFPPDVTLRDPETGALFCGDDPGDGPPGDDPGEECEGESDASGGAIKWTNPGEQSIQEFCTDFFSQDQEPCQDVLGYIDGHQLCNDDQAECEASGGTYGAAGIGDDISTAICIPDDFADDLPSCDDSEVVVLDQPDPNSLDASFACSGGVDPPLDPDPTTSTPRPDPDIDGDGIPDYNDGDMDGDGIPNSTDSDADGDGVADVDDGQIGGSAPDPRELGSASGGGTCAQRPQCSGDPIACAILWQSWSTRCAIEEPDIPNGFEDQILNGPGTDPAEVAIRDDGDIDLASPFTYIFTPTQIAGACPAARSISFTGLGDVAFEWTSMCDFASYVRPLVLLIFGWVAVRIGMRGFE